MRKDNRIIFITLLLFMILLTDIPRMVYASTLSEKSDVIVYSPVADSCPYYGAHRGAAIRYDLGRWENLSPSDRNVYLYECDCGAKIVCTGHPSDPNSSVGYYSTNFKQRKYGDYYEGKYRFIIYGSSYSSSNTLFNWQFYK